MAKTENLQAKITKRLKERINKVLENEGINQSDFITYAVLKALPEFEKRIEDGQAPE